VRAWAWCGQPLLLMWGKRTCIYVYSCSFNRGALQEASPPDHRDLWLQDRLPPEAVAANVDVHVYIFSRLIGIF